jgi:hypothetical protein
MVPSGREKSPSDDAIGSRTDEERDIKGSSTFNLCFPTKKPKDSFFLSNIEKWQVSL